MFFVVFPNQSCSLVSLGFEMITEYDGVIFITAFTKEIKYLH